MSVVGNPIGNPIWVKLGSLMQNNMPTTVITVWTVVQTVLTATFNSYEIDKIHPPPQNQYPWTDRKKLGTVDYVYETTPYTKLGTNTHTGGFWVNGWSI